MSDFEQWFNQYMLNKTDSCLDRDILRWAKPILEVAFDLQMLYRFQGYTLPFKGSKKYLKLEQENEKLKEQLEELRLSIPHIDNSKDSYIARIEKANEMLENIREYSVVYTPTHKVIEAVINTLNNEQIGE